MKKIMTTLLILAVMTACLAGCSSGNKISVSISSKCAIACDHTSGETIYKKHADSKTSPASLVKLMVVLLAVENIDDLSVRTATIQKDYDYIKAVTEDDSNDFEAGEKATINDYLHAMMMNSSADASMTVLRYLGGGNMEKGVAMMNKRAAELGMDNTHFVDAIGDDKKDTYTTCSDLAKLMDYALDNKTFLKLLTTKTYTLGADNKRDSAEKIENTIFLYADKDSLIQGGKVGYTPFAKKALASYAKINGHQYYCISTQAKTSSEDKYPNITDAETIFKAISKLN